MSLLVVGSMAYDSVKTPFGEVKEALGGSATYFSMSASYFTDVSVVAVVGNDFSEEDLNLLRERSIDVEGIEKREGRTFRWKGEYGFDLNDAHTLDTCLNVFADFQPNIPEKYKGCEYVFLGNIDPELQGFVLNQIKKPKLVACDTMNFWIEGKLDFLKKTISRVDIAIINEAEARELGGNPNIVKAAKNILSLGAKSLVIKRGEYGVLLFSDSHIFSAPAYPLESVYDPTGAGDSFAGGFMGYLANNGNINDRVIRQAIIFGSVMASYNVEDFSLNRLKSLNRNDIEKRYNFLKRLTHFEDITGY